jgi:PAS domain S-box-containing protein
MQQGAHKTNAHLLDELRELRKRNIELEILLANSKAAEENLRAVSETALDAVIISDQDGNIVFWNKTATEIFGYEKDEVLGNPITMLISDVAIKKYNIAKEHVLERGFSLFGKKPIESVAKRKDGTEFPAEFTVSNWKVKDRYYFGGSLRDISEQKRIEKEYERILNMSQDLICIAGTDGYFKYVNPVWEKMLGYPRVELLTRPFLDFIHPEDHQKNDAEVAKLSSGNVAEGFENRYIHKNGSIRIFNWTAAPLPEKGLMYCIGRDITERKRAEEALGKSEARYRELVNNSKNAIAIYEAIEDGRDFIFKEFNHAAENIEQIKKEVLIGKGITEVFPGIKEFGLLDVFRRVWKTGKPEEFPISFYQDDRISGWRDNYIYRLPTGEIVAIYEDVTERKLMEHELQKSHDELEKKVKQRTVELAKTNKELQASREHLKKFAGMLLSVREEERKNISTSLHDELGSMAISVDSPMSIAKEEVKTNNRNAAIKAIEQSQAALRKAVDDLRKLAAGLRPPSLEIIGLTSALNDFISNFKKHSAFEITFRNDLAKKKISDDVAIVIYRIIQEALTNIVKHAKAHDVSVSLYSHKNKVHLDIQDDGVGFDIDKVSKKKEDLKIGIQGMRERVESLGGEFMIKSAFKEGTQLKATLPII